MTRQPLTTRLSAKARDIRYDNYINGIHPPNPNMPPYPANPFKELRIETGLTVQGCADLIGVSKQTLIRTEQGLFDEPPSLVLDYWIMQGENGFQLFNDYEEFQVAVRSRHRRMFGDIDELTFQNITIGAHPLRILLANWVTGEPMNVTELAKLLCISQPLINSWVRNKGQVKVPSPLLRALFVSGYSEAELEIFVEAYRVWRLLDE